MSYTASFQNVTVRGSPRCPPPPPPPLPFPRPKLGFARSACWTCWGVCWSASCLLWLLETVTNVWAFSHECVCVCARVPLLTHTGTPGLTKWTLCTKCVKYVQTGINKPGFHESTVCMKYVPISINKAGCNKWTLDEICTDVFKRVRLFKKWTLCTKFEHCYNLHVRLGLKLKLCVRVRVCVWGGGERTRGRERELAYALISFSKWHDILYSCTICRPAVLCYYYVSHRSFVPGRGPHRHPVKLVSDVDIFSRFFVLLVCFALVLGFIVHCLVVHVHSFLTEAL